VGHPAIGERLDKFLHSAYPDQTRSHFQSLINQGLILVNNKPVKSGHKLRVGDAIWIHFQSLPLSENLKAEEIPLDIVYEDEYLLVINKPAGLVVHPGAGNRNGTLVNGLLYHCKSLSTINGILRPGIVHRLDKNTSGLLVVAKSDAIHVYLARQFESHDIIRTYQAVVWGDFTVAEGKIESFIDRSKKERQKMTVVRNHGKWALTTYRLLRSFKYFSFIELVLKTGRTHQIRVHLNYIHHPVFGDPEYNGRHSQISCLPVPVRPFAVSLLKTINRQALHARRLSFIHPQSKGRMNFESPLPSDIQHLVDELATR
jgi:23S rRNA pseudouridine1911/1915/1917 synthase